MTYVFIPAYNEEKNIGFLIEKIGEVLSGKKFQVVVIDDGSKDMTAEIVKDFVTKFPVSLISHGSNRGIGGVFKSILSFVNANCLDEDCSIVIEADQTNNPELLPVIVERLEQKADIVICSRYVGSGGYVNFPLSRKFLSRSANFFLKILFPKINTRDFTIFFRGYRAGIMKQASLFYGNRLIESKGFFANTEILVKILKQRPVEITNIPLQYNYGMKKGRSKMNVSRTMKEYCLLLWKTKTRYILGKRNF